MMHQMIDSLSAERCDRVECGKGTCNQGGWYLGNAAYATMRSILIEL